MLNINQFSHKKRLENPEIYLKTHKKIIITYLVYKKLCLYLLIYYSEEKG